MATRRSVACMVTLARPHARYQQSYLEASDEFLAAGDEQHGGILVWPADDLFPGVEFTREGLTDPREFERFVANRLGDEQPDSPRPTGWVPCTYLWMVQDDAYVGAVSLRHNLDNPFLAELGGHIGYSVRPSMRRRGHATDALRHTVALAADRGIEQVLVTCDEGNVASARTIESCGGEYEDTRQGKRRYWIATRA